VTNPPPSPPATPSPATPTAADAPWDLAAVGRRVRALRTARDLSLAKLAKRTASDDREPLTGSAIQAIEVGKQGAPVDATVSSLARLARALARPGEDWRAVAAWLAFGYGAAPDGVREAGG
jgi:transcriptional regulator with XRE-family HTH domain